MKILLQNTAMGLIPMYGTDYDERKKLKIGEIYSAEIKKPRNYKFHKKYFALLNMAYENLNEEMTRRFPSFENFRSAVQVMAGHYDTSWLLDTGEEIIIPKSISFSSMNEFEFTKMYDNLFSVLMKNVFTGSNKDLIEQQLTNFY